MGTCDSEVKVVGCAGGEKMRRGVLKRCCNVVGDVIDPPWLIKTVKDEKCGDSLTAR